MLLASSITTDTLIQHTYTHTCHPQHICAKMHPPILHFLKFIKAQLEKDYISAQLGAKVAAMQQLLDVSVARTAELQASPALARVCVHLVSDDNNNGRAMLMRQFFAVALGGIRGKGDLMVTSTALWCGGCPQVELRAAKAAVAADVSANSLSAAATDELADVKLRLDAASRECSAQRAMLIQAQVQADCLSIGGTYKEHVERKY